MNRTCPTPFFGLLFLLLACSSLAQPQRPDPAATGARPIELRGEVIAFDFNSPLTRVVFDVRNSDGSSSAWTAEAGSAAELRRYGWTSDILAPGEIILVRGQLLDAAAGRIALQEIERVNGVLLSAGESRVLTRLSSGTYQLVPGRSYVRLSFDHQGFSRASFWFTRMHASLELAADGSPGSLQVDLLAEDLESGSAELTRLLKSSALLASSTYPVISFSSERILHLDGNRYRVDGQLAIKGVTHPMQLLVVVNKAGAHPLTGNPGFGISARGDLDRANWGLDQFGPEVGLAMAIEVEAEFELGL